MSVRDSLIHHFHFAHFEPRNLTVVLFAGTLAEGRDCNESKSGVGRATTEAF